MFVKNIDVNRKMALLLNEGEIHTMQRLIILQSNINPNTSEGHKVVNNFHESV